VAGNSNKVTHVTDENKLNVHENDTKSKEYLYQYVCPIKSTYLR